MIYSSVLNAVVAALNAEARDNTSHQAWQKLYNPHDEEQTDLSLLGGSRTAGMDQGEMACWVHARLQSRLQARHWYALRARFSLHKVRKVEAIGALVPMVNSSVPRLFLYKAVTAWAIPPLKGVKAVGNGTRRSTDMLVLPDEFYDITTWDTQGLNRSTYWRWKKAVEATLDGMVIEALEEAKAILLHEGIIFSKIA